ncbi:inositol monophosphatase family protein [Streptomyces hoynatensis]|uniref:inositol monophosphatase family protein n=1 Tax=Streptomyces hoynatensis TaxID=1141874 RepID=UPI001F4E19E0|nr:inositol monophosphatase family protein [Streptomyces hoynatensis]
MPPSPYGELLGLALRAARSGASEIAARAGRPTGVRLKSQPTDPATDADRASESAIRRLIAAERPGDGLIGEEGEDRPPDSGVRWTIDPLDGTVNYLYGIPHHVVSIACEERAAGRWRTVVGVVHDPARAETFTAVRGGGARLNGAAIAVNDAVGLPLALVATGFSYRPGSRARQAAVLPRLLPRVRDLRSSGSSALDLCWTAAGRYDGFYEDELFPWDWRAGALLVREAGGVVSPLGSGVLAAGPALYGDLRELLSAARPPRSPRREAHRPPDPEGIS